MSCRSVCDVILQEVKERGKVLAECEIGLMVLDDQQGWSGRSGVCKWMMNGRGCRWSCSSDGGCDGCVRSV